MTLFGDIEIRPLRKLAEMDEMVRLQRAVWKADTDIDTVPASLLLAFSKHGGLVMGAFDGPTMVGLHFSFLARDEDGDLYQWSHVTGVLEDYQRTGLGEAIKWAQCDAVLASGLNLVRWTVDPLEGVNNSMNFGKLGVTSRTYGLNVYGMMDGINAGIETDRFTVDWQLDSERVEKRRSEGRPHLDVEMFEARGAARAIETEPAGEGVRRVVASHLDLTAPLVLVETPGNYQTVKQTDMDLAVAWRMRTREAFTAYFDSGYVAMEFVSETEEAGRRNFYVLQRG